MGAQRRACRFALRSRRPRVVIRPALRCAVSLSLSLRKVGQGRAQERTPGRSGAEQARHCRAEQSRAGAGYRIAGMRRSQQSKSSVSRMTQKLAKSKVLPALLTPASWKPRILQFSHLDHARKQAREESHDKKHQPPLPAPRPHPTINHHKHTSSDTRNGRSADLDNAQLNRLSSLIDLSSIR